MTYLPKSRHTGLIVQEFVDELLIYDLKTNKGYCLNKTSALVYQLCDGTRSVADLAGLISSGLSILVGEDVIRLALEGLQKEGLLEQSKDMEIDLKGLSRRQVVKKIGFRSLVALPVIASIVAPEARAASSICYSSRIGLCRSGGTEACPPSCPPGTPIHGTLYSSTNGTCSGGAIGTFAGGCPSNPIFFDYIIN